MYEINKKKVIIIFIVVFIIILFFPYIITRDNPYFNFDEGCGSIGDTIGGTTAPIIGLFSIALLILTLSEQLKFNEEQKKLAFDEQFKSMLFKLLNDQREIYSKIAPLEKEVDFFQSAKIELKKIFQVLDCDYFYTKEEMERASDKNDELETNVFGIGLFPEEVKQKYQANQLICTIFQNARKYGITEGLFQRYKDLEPQLQVACGYMVFYNRYNQVGVYFRHLYHIIKFIAETEQSEIDIFYHGKTNAEIEKKYRDYAQFVQARMSFDELLLLFYNSFLFRKMQNYLIRYDLLESLNVENLVSQYHNCIPNYQLKMQKTLYQRIQEIIDGE